MAEFKISQKSIDQLKARITDTMQEEELSFEYLLPYEEPDKLTDNDIVDLLCRVLDAAIGNELDLSFAQLID